jgi:rubrerythrin
MELETLRFYERASQRITDASIRKLLDDLAEVERRHYAQAGSLEQKHVTPPVKEQEDAAQRRLLLLQERERVPDPAGRCHRPANRAAHQWPSASGE